MDVIHSRDLMKGTMDRMSQSIHQMVRDQLKKLPNVQPDFEERMRKLTDDMLKEFPYDDMIQAMIPVYPKHFTKADVDALIAFYSTPIGQKVLKQMPEIMAEAMQASSGIIQKMMEKTMQRVQDEIAAQLSKTKEANPKNH